MEKKEERYQKKLANIHNLITIMKNLYNYSTFTLTLGLLVADLISLVYAEGLTYVFH